MEEEREGRKKGHFSVHKKQMRQPTEVKREEAGEERREKRMKRTERKRR